MASEVDLAAPLSRTVYVGDASTKGYSLLETEASPREVLAASLFKEKWRFREAEVPFVAEPGPPSRQKPWAPHQAGVSAVLERFSKVLAIPSRRAPVPGKVPTRTELLEVVGSVPRLDDAWEEPSRWKLVIQRAWAY